MHNDPQRPTYEPPEVITYSDDDILDQLGPAHAQYQRMPGLAVVPPPVSPV